MSKTNRIYLCRTCGYQTLKWLGRCPSCASWNTLDETVHEDTAGTRDIREVALTGMEQLQDGIPQRMNAGMGELNRVLGGGIVRGSAILVGGDPGIGKSTILLQMCAQADTVDDILYFSGEESLSQIGIRAARVCARRDNLLFASETDADSIAACIKTRRPGIAIIDSIQTVSHGQSAAAPGSAALIRNVALSIIQAAKQTDTALFLVGHVTKDGSIAGPRILEHMVDTVLYFEGDRSGGYRILRAVKNRFGSTNEIGVFEMKEEGLREIGNPSALFLSGRHRHAVGSCVIPVMEGTRPMLCEIQALVCASPFPMPRRMSDGIDNNRVVMLTAVLEKQLGMKLYNCDTYINVAGGLKVDEPACDLALLCAVASSFKNVPLKESLVVMGEVGLTGEIRGVSRIEQRIMEAAKLGFLKAVIPGSNLSQARKAMEGMEFAGVDSVQEAMARVF